MAHHTLTPIENEVIETVLRIHPEATPCGSKKGFDECFMEYDHLPDEKSFWYNLGKNTHVVRFKKNSLNLVAMIGGKKFQDVAN